MAVEEASALSRVFDQWSDRSTLELNPPWDSDTRDSVYCCPVLSRSGLVFVLKLHLCRSLCRPALCLYNLGLWVCKIPLYHFELQMSLDDLFSGVHPIWKKYTRFVRKSYAEDIMIEVHELTGIEFDIVLVRWRTEPDKNG